MASIILPIYTGTHNDERIAACVFGFLVAILYAVEGFVLKNNAPENLSEHNFLYSFVYTNFHYLQFISTY